MNLYQNPRNVLHTAAHSWLIGNHVNEIPVQYLKHAYFQSRYSFDEIPDTKEVLLWRAILVMAIEDLTDRIGEEFKSAFQWVNGDQSKSSFPICCEALSLDSSRIAMIRRYSLDCCG